MIFFKNLKYNDVWKMFGTVVFMEVMQSDFLNCSTSDKHCSKVHPLHPIHNIYQNIPPQIMIY